jgi:hypothetical protein
MNEAIKLALKNGWDDTNYAYGATESDDIKVGTWYYPQGIVLDPLFWQALGKALGWKKAKGNMSYALNEIVGIPAWQTYAHDYFDLLLIGSDTEKFWKELLNQ